MTPYPTFPHTGEGEVKLPALRYGKAGKTKNKEIKFANTYHHVINRRNKI